MNKAYNKSIFKLIITPLLIGITTFIAYFSSLNYPFQFDDAPNITKLFNIRSKDFSSLFFSGPRWIIRWLNTINYKIGEFDPFIYRLFNVAFHIISGILVFYFIYLALSGLKKNSYFKDNAFAIAALTSVLFLLHPVQTQTVSYVIQGQMEGLASLFVISINLCYLILSKRADSFFKFLLTILLFALTILSTGTKEIAIVAPFLVMLTDWFFVAQGDWQSFKKRLPLQIGLFITTFSLYFYFLKPKYFADILGLNLIANNNIGNILTKSPLEKITPIHFLISQFKVILHYLFIFIWPFNISVEYDWKLSDSFFSFDSFVPFLILLSIAIITCYLLKKDKINIFAFGIIWFFIAIAPRSSIIPSAELLVDYKTYLASVGWLLILSVGLLKLSDYISKKWRTLLFILFTLFLATLTYHRNKVWRTALEFWENIVQNEPKARALNNYGVELSALGRYSESIPYFKKAINLEGSSYWDPYTNLSAVYAITGKIDLAIATLKKSLDINKYQPEAYNNLGSYFIHKKDYDSAEKCFIAALAIVPHYGRAMYNYGRIYLAKNDIESAWEYFKKACTQADLDHDPATFDLYASTSINLKKYDDAIFAYNKILSLTNNTKALNETLFNLGNAYFLNDQLDESVKTFKELIRRDPTDYRAWCNLIESYIQLKEFEKALEVIKQAKANKISFEGLEIQEAKCLASLDYIEMACSVLQKFLNQPQPNENLKNIAKRMMTKLKK